MRKQWREGWREPASRAHTNAAPISWQDTGTGVFTLAGASLLLALLTARHDPAPRTAVLALWTALAALLIDIYLY